MPADPAAVKALFLEAVALDDPVTRAALVSERCREDAALLARVHALLLANDQAVANEGTAPFGAAHGGETQPAADLPGKNERVGAILGGKYKLIEEVGEGGMGSVFMAQQMEPVKRAVAVKVIKAGMDSRAVLARFEAERQALAMMDHPNVARVLDAGTTESGRPFFVMELVKGAPITQFCDQRNLTPRQRLELFVPVCQAIQHAHQKGVIHRDIKPSNVLVAMYDDRPVPKVIDFGLAKAAGQSLTDKTLMTGFGALVGTPEYMSPEQANLNNLDIDTRSDVYALGVLLYELLTGSTPVDRKSLGQAALLEILRIVREVEAPRPSAKLSTIDTLPSVAANRGTEPGKLTKLMKGELDWVLLKALEKDRSRRYQTANGLARDLQRYLDDEVVEARPPSTSYRLKKFVRRHKGQVLAASLVLFALLAGMAGTTWGLIEARRQEVAAIAYADEATAQARLASDNARQAETEARSARKAEQEARDRATAEAAAKALAHQEMQRAAAEKMRAEEQLTRAEWLVYAGKLMLAQTDFETGNGALALQYLDECQHKLRGWEHRYLWTRINAKLTLRGHTHRVRSVAFSPDGKRIVSGSHDRTAKVWDAENGQELLAFKGHTGQLTSVAFDPGGKRIVSGSDDGTARVWDAENGQELLALTGHTGGVASVVFSPDGKRLVTASGNSAARVWDAATGQELLALKGQRGHVTSMAFSPDGKRLVTNSNSSLAKVWDAATGDELLALKGHTAGVVRVAFSPDGKRLVSGSWDRTAKVWDAETGQEVLALRGHTGAVTSVAFSPDGKRVLTGSGDATVRVWDASTAQEILVLKGHATRITAQVWSVAFSPDGNRLVSGGEDRTLRVWDAERGQEVLALKGARGPTAFSPDSKRIAARSGVWDAATGQELLALKGHTRRVNSVAFSPNGDRLVTGSEDSTAKLWDAATGQELLTLKGHTGRVMSVAFSPDGKCILSGGGTWQALGEAKVWDAATGQERMALKGHTNSVTSVAFSPDGKRMVTASGDSTAKVWDAATGQELFALKDSSWMFSVAFSPDGKRLVTGNFHGKTAKVWDAATGQELFVLKGHTGFVLSVAYSPDGKRIVTSGWEPVVRVWNAATGQEVLALKGHTGTVTSVAFSPDGKCLVTGGDDGVKVWVAETGQATRIGLNSSTRGASDEPRP